jgi:hypothetical protein
MVFGGGDVPDVPFADAYKPGEIRALWNALKKVYGSDEAARQAVSKNNQVLCPLYCSPSLLNESKAALVQNVGKDEALRIMKQSPMILTCGSELATLKADDIRSTARTREFVDSLFGPSGLVVVVTILVLLKLVGNLIDAYL